MPEIYDNSILDALGASRDTVSISSAELRFHPFYRRGECLSNETILTLASQMEDSLKTQPEPISQCHFAIALFHEMLESGDPEFRNAFLNCSERILKSIIPVSFENRKGGFLPNWHVIDGHHPHTRPWISCQAQSWGICILLRAFQLTGSRKFLDASMSLAVPFLVPVSAGGVQARERTGRVFFEKIPFGGTSRHILNGFLSSLVGLHELSVVSCSSLAADLLGLGAAALDDEVLQTFDIGYTSLYGQYCHRAATPACVYYNRVHVNQLTALSRILNKPHLRTWVRKWSSYATDWRYRSRSSANCFAYRLRMIPRYSLRITKTLTASLANIRS